MLYTNEFSLLFTNQLMTTLILDFEQSDECIDFTMMCVVLFILVSEDTFYKRKML